MTITIATPVIALSDHPTWHRGPPPSPDWYVASTERDTVMRRYWNGRHWSPPVWVQDTAAELARCRLMRDEASAADVQWLHAVPEPVGERV